MTLLYTDTTGDGEQMRTKLARRFIASVVTVAFGTSLVACSESDQQLADETTTGAPTTQIVDPSYPIDMEDQRQLAGLVDTIFVGNVEEQIGSKSRTGIPEQQFRVTVIETLKGDVKGEVTVNQQGGLGEDGTVFLVDGDEIIKPGQAYLFATKISKTDGWYTLAPNVGDIPLGSASGDQLGRSNLVDSPEVQKMRDSISNEIPYK